MHRAFAAAPHCFPRGGRCSETPFSNARECLHKMSRSKQSGFRLWSSPIVTRRSRVPPDFDTAQANRLQGVRKISTIAVGGLRALIPSSGERRYAAIRMAPSKLNRHIVKLEVAVVSQIRRGRCLRFRSRLKVVDEILRVFVPGSLGDRPARGRDGRGLLAFPERNATTRRDPGREGAMRRSGRRTR